MRYKKAKKGKRRNITKSLMPSDLMDGRIEQAPVPHGFNRIPYRITIDTETIFGQTLRIALTFTN